MKRNENLKASFQNYHIRGILRMSSNKGYALAMGVAVLAVVFIGFMATTGFFALPEPPAIKSAEVYPQQAGPNNVLLITAGVEDRQGVRRVDAANGNDRAELTLIEGNANKGTYQGSWIVRGPPGKKDITITATNVLNKKASITVQYEVV